MSNPLDIADYREMMRRDFEFLNMASWPVLFPGRDMMHHLRVLHFGNYHWSPFSGIPFEESPLSLVFSNTLVSELQDQFNRELNERIWGAAQ